MAGPFGAQPSAYVVAGDLGLVAEQFGGIFELLDRLNSAADHAEVLERCGVDTEVRENGRHSRRVVLQESAVLLPGAGSRAADLRDVEECMEFLAGV